MLTSSKLNELSQIEIKQADKNTLVDIQDIKIDPAQSREKRMESYISQIKNPYLFLCDDTVVQVRFNQDGNELQQKLKNFYINAKNT